MSYFWIVDDEQSICWALKKALETQGHRVKTFSNAEDALEFLNPESAVDAIMLDNRLPGMSGFDAAAIAKRRIPTLPIIMMTAFGDLSTAIQAMQIEVFEYLTKPFDLADAIKSLTQAVVSRNAKSKAPYSVADQIDHDVLLGNSTAMQLVYKRIALAARSDVPVLITGDSGTGKESVASAIHKYSQRASRPFLPLVPVTIDPDAIASALFGSVHHNLSDNKSGRTGILELVDDGTLYIEEITDLPLSVQSQLLRVLEHKQYSSDGDHEIKYCRTRIIASTTRDPYTAVAEGELTQELLLRLSAFTLELMPLAKRRDDIEPLARSILARHPSSRAKDLTPAAIAELVRRDWPGNIRELRNAIEFALTVARGSVIDVDDLPKALLPTRTVEAFAQEPIIEKWVRTWVLDRLATMETDIPKTGNAQPLAEYFGTIHEEFLSVVELPLIRAMLDRFDGNRARVAQLLGLHRSTLRQKMRRYQLD